MKELTCITMFVFGSTICAVTGHAELAGLGMIILAGLLRIAFGIDDRQLDETQ